MTANKRRRTLPLAAALSAFLSLQSAADGHGLRHGRRGHDHSHHHHSHGHHHHHHGPVHDEAEEAGHYDHRHLTSFSGEGNVTDVFEGCMLACYGDVVERYGRELAEQMRADGFHFEPCEDEEEGAEIYSNDTEQSRALKRILGATNQVHRLWNRADSRSPGGRLEIPYAIRSGVFGSETYETIASAISYIESATGVLKFVPRTNELEYMHFNFETHYARICAANLGRQANRPTNIYLGWCQGMNHRGSVVHEMLHALGFWHEHSRPDRDAHVHIEWDNIVDGAERNFNKAVDVDVLGTEYDFGSIMHYPDNGFSVQYSTKKTIVPVVPLEKWETMGQRVRLSDHDVREVRKLYQCRTGPRSEGLGVDTLCTADCPCWEHALGNCDSDDECMDDLVCRPTPDASVLVTDPTDQLPHYTDAAPGTQIKCNDYCHPGCCSYSNNIVLCPVTCDTAPPREDLEVPTTMCVRDDGDAPAARVATTTKAATDPPTESVTSPPTAAPSDVATEPPTDPPTEEHAWWYSSAADKCVAFCDGPPPCGGFSGGETIYRTVRECCDAELGYMPFEDCHTIPDRSSGTDGTESGTTTDKSGSTVEKRTSSLSDSPTDEPTATPPTASPSSPVPTGGPTEEGTTAVPTWPPTPAIPTYSPTLKPTEEGTTAVPTWPPTPAVPTYAPTSDDASGAPTLVPSLNPAVPITTTTSTTTTTTTTEATEPAAVFEGSGDYYMDWDLQKCVRDCVGPRPCRDRRKQNWETGYRTVDECCRTVPYVDDCSYAPEPVRTETVAKAVTNTMTARSGAIGTTATDEEEESVWYPGGLRCLDDGLVPSWQTNRYADRGACCRSHFSWSYGACMQTAPGAASGATTRKWFVDWGRGRCVTDCSKSEGGSCGGKVPGAWVTTHDSAGQCCRAHMSYMEEACRNESSS